MPGQPGLGVGRACEASRPEQKTTPWPAACIARTAAITAAFGASSPTRVMSYGLRETFSATVPSMSTRTIAGGSGGGGCTVAGGARCGPCGTGSGNGRSWPGTARAAGGSPPRRPGRPPAGGVAAQALVQRHVGEVVHLEVRAEPGGQLGPVPQRPGAQVGVVHADVHPGPQQRLDLGPLGGGDLALGPLGEQPLAVQHPAQVVPVDPDHAGLERAGEGGLAGGGQAPGGDQAESSTSPPARRAYPGRRRAPVRRVANAPPGGGNA